MDTAATSTLGRHRGNEVPSGGPTRAADNTLTLLRSLIFTGQIEAGEKLPPERILAEELGTSRITVGYALRVLEGLGFVEVRIGRYGGWWVVDAGSLAALWRTWKNANAEEIRLLLEYAELVETDIVALAALRRTPQELKTLREALAEFECTGTIRPHHSFHAALADATHNPYLQQAVDLAARELFMPSDRVVLVPGKLAEFHEGHERIVAAVEEQDAAAARAAMKTHYRFSRYIFALDE